MQVLAAPACRPPAALGKAYVAALAACHSTYPIKADDEVTLLSTDSASRPAVAHATQNLQRQYIFSATLDNETRRTMGCIHCWQCASPVDRVIGWTVECKWSTGLQLRTALIIILSVSSLSLVPFALSSRTHLFNRSASSCIFLPVNKQSTMLTPTPTTDVGYSYLAMIS